MAGLPPAARLRRAADFAALRQASERLQARHFTLRWRPVEMPRCRLGMAVSRKVSKRAVIRNRIKRVIRESFRARYAALPPFDVLVIARTSAVLATRAQLRDDLDAAWHKLGALKPIHPPGTIDG